MTARDTLTNLFTDSGVTAFGEASDKATRLYGQIRREVLDDLARSGIGLPEMLELAGTGDHRGEPIMSRGEANDLWHKIRGAALLQAAERLAEISAMAKHPKIRFSLDYAAKTVHKMIINPKGGPDGAQGTAGPEGDPGELRTGQ